MAKRQLNVAGPAVKVGGAAVKSLEAAAFVGELVEVKGTVEAILGYLREADAHRTERARIEAESRAHLERVRAFRHVVVEYLDRAFDERKNNFDALFARLDLAMERGDPQVAVATLEAMVDIAKHSPLQDLADAGRFQRAIEDKDTDWRF